MPRSSGTPAQPGRPAAGTHASNGHEAEAVEPRNAPWRVITASLAGTSIEFYDFYIYATAATIVFPKLFFPDTNPTAALLASFTVFGVAFIARPLGSVIFGHFGDRIGRKGTLVATLLLMGIATFVIGLLPTALTPGWEIAAPVLLTLMRFCQGLGLGGEWSGAALLATENAPAGKRAIYGTFPQLGAPIGFILGNTMFVLLSLSMSEETFMAWGWRVPFLLSAALVVLGLWVRLSLLETPAFQKVMDEGHVAKLPLATVFRSNWKEIILGTFIMLATYVLFYMMTAFTLTFGTTKTHEQAAASDSGYNAAQHVPGLGYDRVTFLIMLIAAVVFFGIFTLISGPLAERYGRRRMLLWVTGGIIAFGFLMTPMLAGGFLGVQGMLVLGMCLMGLTFGPMSAYLPELFPANVRYTGSAIAYNLSSVLGAAIAPSIFIALWSAGGGSPFWVGAYLAGSAVLTIAALGVSPETRHRDYVTHSA